MFASFDGPLAPGVTCQPSGSSFCTSPALALKESTSRLSISDSVCFSCADAGNDVATVAASRMLAAPPMGLSVMVISSSVKEDHLAPAIKRLSRAEAQKRFENQGQ